VQSDLAAKQRCPLEQPPGELAWNSIVNILKDVFRFGAWAVQLQRFQTFWVALDCAVHAKDDRAACQVELPRHLCNSGFGGADAAIAGGDKGYLPQGGGACATHVHSGEQRSLIHGRNSRPH
jgi:hypothetical protein